MREVCLLWSTGSACDPALHGLMGIVKNPALKLGHMRVLVAASNKALGSAASHCCVCVQVLDSFGPVSTNEHYVDAFPVKGGRNPADDSARELSKAERGPHGTFAAPGAYRV